MFSGEPERGLTAFHVALSSQILKAHDYFFFKETKFADVATDTHAGNLEPMRFWREEETSIREAEDGIQRWLLQKCHQTCFKRGEGYMYRGAENHRIGRDLQGHLVQPPAPSRKSS